MKKKLSVGIVLIIIGVVSFGAFMLLKNKFLNPKPRIEENTIFANKTKTHFDPTYGFSFDYPSDLTVGDIPSGDEGKAIIVQKTQGDSKTSGFQMTISSFDEPDQVLTKERIQQDAPEITVENPQEAIIGQNLHVLIFEGTDPGLGKTREVWMVKSGNLYQITAPFEFDTELAGILKTWRFD